MAVSVRPMRKRGAFLTCVTSVRAFVRMHVAADTLRKTLARLLIQRPGGYRERRPAKEQNERRFSGP